MGTQKVRRSKNSTVQKKQLCWLEQCCFEGQVINTKVCIRNESTPEGILAHYSRLSGTPGEVVRVPDQKKPEKEIVIGRLYRRPDDELYILFITDGRTREFVDIGRQVRRS